MTTQKEVPMEWEEGVIVLAKEYARMSYLVSEENHDEQEENEALDNLIASIRRAIAKAVGEARKEWEGKQKIAASALLTGVYSKARAETIREIADKLGGMIKKEKILAHEVRDIAEEAGYNHALSDAISYVNSLKK